MVYDAEQQVGSWELLDNLSNFVGLKFGKYNLRDNLVINFINSLIFYVSFERIAKLHGFDSMLRSN